MYDGMSCHCESQTRHSPLKAVEVVPPLTTNVLPLAIVLRADVEDGSTTAALPESLMKSSRVVRKSAGSACQPKHTHTQECHMHVSHFGPALRAGMVMQEEWSSQSRTRLPRALKKLQGLFWPAADTATAP